MCLMAIGIRKVIQTKLRCKVILLIIIIVSHYVNCSLLCITIQVKLLINCLFGFGCFWGFRPTRECFTHMETSTWPVKGCKFWPMLRTHGHWAVRVLWLATPTETRDIRLWWSSPKTRDTHSYCRTFDSGAVTTCVTT